MENYSQEAHVHLEQLFLGAAKILSDLFCLSI